MSAEASTSHTTSDVVRYGANCIHIHIHTHPAPPPAAATSPSEPAHTEPPGKNNRKYGVGAFDFQIVSCCSIR
ncbi:hypothetical protein B0H13DRAFT_2377432 [Mycena leptocephala]|nr:hypothetical protein B0H13DRAFT_2377432 [Mycena leptocephala]